MRLPCTKIGEGVRAPLDQDGIVRRAAVEEVIVLLTADLEARPVLGAIARELLRLTRVVRDVRAARRVGGGRRDGLARAVTYSDLRPADALPVQPIKVRFTDVTDQMFDESADRSAAAMAIIDMDENGRYTFLVVGSDGNSVLGWGANKMEG